MMETMTKDERVNFRIHADVKADIERAARLQGLNVSDFIISASLDAAKRLIMEHSIIQIADVEFERFHAALGAEIMPNEAALAAARRFNESTVELPGGVRLLK